MCGICGSIDWNSTSPPDPSLMDRMTDVLAHRGPDDRGVWQSHSTFLGNRRLSIIDLAGGRQPMGTREGRFWITYNGELYNFLDLRSELEAKGHLFTSKSDTEVVLRAYEEWKEECLDRFNGMFAFAIWDTQQRCLFLARDRIGEKPLYYFYDGHRLIFASEIKAILADGTVPREIDLQGLANFLAYSHSMGPRTIYQNIYKLLPGHYLVCQDRQLQIRQYWDVGTDPEVTHERLASEDKYAQRIRELLSDSVARRLVSDVPVGAFLSGGVDSSAVVAEMARLSGEPVKTFSLGFRVGRSYNELSDARLVARHLGTEHHELCLEEFDLPEALSTLVYHYDEPFGDAAAFPVYLLSSFAREHVKVVLTGEGGDELFGGYRRFVADQFVPFYQWVPRFMHNRVIPALVETMPRMRRIKQVVRSLRVAEPGLRYARWLEVFTPEMQAELLRPEMCEGLLEYNPSQPYVDYYWRAANGLGMADHLNRMMYVDLKSWLVDAYLKKVDKATMAVGLEARLPLLDHRLVELAFRIPSRYKIRGWSTKRIFKRALRGVLPGRTLRKRKHGFAVPTDLWFRGVLKDYAWEVLFDPRTRARGFFRQRYVERLYQDHVQGREVRDTHLWLLLVFELWHRCFLD